MEYLEKFPKSIHTIALGGTGTGKSTLGQKYCELKYLNDKAKIIDLQNNRQMECCCFMFPTSNAKFRRTFMNYYGVSDISKIPDANPLKPQGFKTEIWHPIITDLPKKLPENIKLFTLPVDALADENVLKVITSDTMGDASYVSLTQEISKMSSTESFPGIPSRIIKSANAKVLKTKGIKKSGKGVDMLFYYDASPSASASTRPLLKVKDLGIFSSRNYEHCLTDDKLLKILKDKDTITGFSTKWIDSRHEKIKLAITLYLMTRIREMAYKVGNEVVVYIREAREIFPHPKYTDKSKRVLAEVSESMVKDCRRAGIHLLLDTQTPFDLPSEVLSQIDLRFIFNHGEGVSKLLEMYKGMPSLSREHVKRLRRLRYHHFYVSHPNFPASRNVPDGFTLNFMFSGHLEKGEDELKLIKRKLPGVRWYDTISFIESLQNDWRTTSNKHMDKLKEVTKDDVLKTAGEILGRSLSEIKIIKFLYYWHVETDGKEIPDLESIYADRTVRVSYSTARTIMKGLVNEGFVKEGDAKNFYVLPSLIDYVKEHEEVLEIDK